MSDFPPIPPNCPYFEQALPEHPDVFAFVIRWRPKDQEHRDGEYIFHDMVNDAYQLRPIIAAVASMYWRKIHDANYQDGTGLTDVHTLHVSKKAKYAATAWEKWGEL